MPGLLHCQFFFLASSGVEWTVASGRGSWTLGKQVLRG
jgi:hypothetical protein